MNKPYCFITNDVETTSLVYHQLRDETGQLVLSQGMPRLLDLFDELNIKTTFFYTGYIAERFPDVVKIAHQRGHEVASHGYSHLVKNAFDVMTSKKIQEHLFKSKDILEQITGEEVISFRAPALRIKNNFTPYLLDAGFKIDSSVASQRMDMFMSFGSRHKFNWLLSPRSPYFVSEKNIFTKGNSDLLEIPVTSILIPYIGTVMRISPLLLKSLRPLILLEKKLFNRHVNFLSHPNEFIDEARDESIRIQKRSRNPMSYLLADVLRYRLKTKNLGKKAMPIYRNELLFLQQSGYEFHRMKDVYANFKLKHAGKRST
ncbi:MAG: polysaccharide deacetylase family protein [Crocinitomicaceae bacterium]